MQKLLALYKKHREVISYLFFGGLTTLVAISTFALFFQLLKWDENLSNILSDICAILFAYATNKTFVFRSKCKTWKELFREMGAFFASRALTTIICIGLFWAVNLLAYNLLGEFDQETRRLASGWIAQAVKQVFMIVANYVLSKLFVFRTKKTNSEEEK